MLCSEKNKYSKKTAEKVCRELREKNKVKLKIYQCVVCHYWHLTKKTRWLKKWDQFVK